MAIQRCLQSLALLVVIEFCYPSPVRTVLVQSLYWIDHCRDRVIIEMHAMQRWRNGMLSLGPTESDFQIIINLHLYT